MSYNFSLNSKFFHYVLQTLISEYIFYKKSSINIRTPLTARERVGCERYQQHRDMVCTVTSSDL